MPLHGQHPAAASLLCLLLALFLSFFFYFFLYFSACFKRNAVKKNTCTLPALVNPLRALSPGMNCRSTQLKCSFKINCPFNLRVHRWSFILKLCELSLLKEIGSVNAFYWTVNTVYVFHSSGSRWVFKIVQYIILYMCVYLSLS